jgi:UDP-N-acetylglucosamine--N-acetylmuramyl-(pentapeptide) pyrophosphoryl-undecaprenol N-acetylglucosamine transferase
MAKVRDLDTLWVGGEGGMEESLVKRQGIHYESIPAAGVHGVGLNRLPGNFVTIARGVLASRRILNDFKPDVLLFTGGYVAVPMALAGRSISSLLYVPDIEPGMALKSLAGMADAIAVTTDESQQYFNKKVYPTGYPLRADLALWDRQTAISHLGLAGGMPVLLVLGGSKGAHSLNTAVINHLRPLLEKFELIHISGEPDWTFVKSTREQLPVDLAARYHACHTCMKWARPWLLPIWLSHARVPRHWVSIHCLGCPPFWSRIRTRGVIKK